MSAKKSKPRYMAMDIQTGTNPLSCWVVYQWSECERVLGYFKTRAGVESYIEAAHQASMMLDQLDHIFRDGAPVKLETPTNVFGKQDNVAILDPEGKWWVWDNYTNTKITPWLNVDSLEHIPPPVQSWLTETITV